MIFDFSTVLQYESLTLAPIPGLTAIQLHFNFFFDERLLPNSPTS